MAQIGEMPLTILHLCGFLWVYGLGLHRAASADRRPYGTPYARAANSLSAL